MLNLPIYRYLANPLPLIFPVFFPCAADEQLNMKDFMDACNGDEAQALHVTAAFNMLFSKRGSSHVAPGLPTPVTPFKNLEEMVEFFKDMDAKGAPR